MSFRSSQPLLKCQFAHRLPGRVRIVCRAVKYLSAEQTDLEDHFSQLRGVRTQRMNCAASSVVLTYDPEAVNDEELLESVESLIQIHSLSALRKEREERNRLLVQERDLYEETLPTMLTRAGIAGTLLVGSWICRRAVPATVLGRLLSPTGFGALALAGPIFRSGIGARGFGAHGAAPPRPRGIAHGLHDELDAQRDPRHAVGGRRGGVAVGGR